jgi:hypothetical protein
MQALEIGFREWEEIANQKQRPRLLVEPLP